VVGALEGTGEVEPAFAAARFRGVHA
jgi:hypothetical protein